jgi:hypothetical protein
VKSVEDLWMDALAISKEAINSDVFAEANTKAKRCIAQDNGYEVYNPQFYFRLWNS